MKIGPEVQNAWSRAIYEASFFGVMVTDGNADCIYTNEKYQSICNCSQEENLGKAWTLSIHPEDKAQVLEAWQQGIDGKQGFNIEYRAYSRQGSILYLSVMAAVVQNEDGAITHICMVQDNSEKMQYAQSLDLKNAYLHSILESSNSAIVSIDADMCYVEFNATYARIVKSRSGVDIKRGDKILAPLTPGSKEYERIKANMERVLNGEEIRTTIEFNKARTAPFDIYEASYTPMYDAANRVIGVSVHFFDLDESLKYEETIREKGYLLRGVLDNVPIVVYKVDRKGNITYSIGSGLRVLGLADQEMVGKNIRERQPEPWAMMEKAFEGQTVTFTASNTFGDRRYYFENHVFADPNDKNQLIAFALDVTLQKEAETGLAQAKQIAEEAVVAKQQFLSNMSHEIRTPMNAVIGMAYLLIHENPKPEQMEYLNTLQFSSQNLMAIINDILDYSKIEAGKIVIEKTDFNLKSLLNSIKQAHLFKAEEKGIGLKVKLDSELPEYVVGDEMRMAQVLNNLMDNAIKFTNTGQVIMEVNLNKQDGDSININFEISDTGIGIPADKVGHIFDSFTQASPDTTRKFGGSGLGLAICKRLLELMGSAIMLKTRVGEGSTFYFNIPLQKSAKEVKTVNDPLVQFEGMSDIRVLLVEDNEINRFVVSKIMRKWGVNTEFAINGMDAIDKVCNNNYDIVLMDLQMPEMDGYEATRRIRAMQEDKYQKLPIVALSASAMLDINEKIQAAGMNDYMSKPFNPIEMYEKIRKHVYKI